MKNDRSKSQLNTYCIVVVALLLLSTTWVVVVYDSIDGCVRLAESFDRPGIPDSLVQHLRDGALEAEHIMVFLQYFQSTEEVMGVYLDSCGQSLLSSRLLLLGIGLASIIAMIIVLVNHPGNSGGSLV
jgi:Trk-type K+ transport system membrane component